MTDGQVYVGAAALGVVAGLRSMAAPAIMTKVASCGDEDESRLGFLGNPIAGHTLTVLAAAEQIADKLPFIPNRTTTGPLIVRAISGALSGAALCTIKKRPIVPGVLFGALGAIGATFAAFELRKRAGEKLHVPDKVLALIEDAVTAGCSTLLVDQLREEHRAIA